MNKIAHFFRTEYGKWLRYVQRLIDDASDRDAEDIIQDVMLNIFDRTDFTQPIENLSAYIYRSLRHRVIDIMRRRKRLEPLHDSLPDLDDDTEEKVEKKELWDQAVEALAELDDDDREIIIATEFEGLTFRELSEAWEIPIGTLLARKSRALQKLRNKLAGLV